MKGALLLLLLSHLAYADPIRVGVIDTGLNLADPRFRSVLCEQGHRDFTGEGIKDLDGHGTHVAGLIKQYAGNVSYCMVIIKFYTANNPNVGSFQTALQWAVDLKLDYINVSVDGSGSSENELKILKNSKSTFIVAAGNQNIDLDVSCSYPACYNLPNMIVVGALKKDGSGKAACSNYGKLVKVWEIGEKVISTLPGGTTGPLTGTSMATAVHTGKLVYEKGSR